MGFRKFVKRLFGYRVETDAISNEDIIVAVMGPTGAGKSSFINIATNSNVLRIGKGLESCTGEVQSVKCVHPRDARGRNVVFVDTPAFNHDMTTELEIETQLKKWLKKTYARKNKIAGILYLHRISDQRMTERPLTHLGIFEQLCGDNFPRKILLTTTMWSLVDDERGTHREADLKTNYWKSMIARGSGMTRFRDSAKSAWDAVDLLLDF